uniref:G2/M-phase specific E3 ubiquitin protein ligase n=1 Tax=Stegastes partitus TaxID=144197 RepID=A0A3B4ZLE1_9TELE
MNDCVLFPGCALCRFSDDDPALFGEKVTLKEHKLSVHYFCLLTSCGVYQRGEENEGIFGFLVDDIKQEIRRSARLSCCVCKKKGACVGCNVRSCRKMVHFPCGRKQMFVSQFTGLFPSYCPDHSPAQSLCGGLDISLPQSCSICLDSIDPVLSFSVLKCPSCHTSWFHRDCVQRQAHSAGLFFFRCTLCNSKEHFQEEMLRMGIYIPERDASWELEANAFSELLEVYTRCDALSCLCEKGPTHSAKSGWFEVIRCRLCGSTGTHRRCSDLNVDTRDWACSECTQATDGKGPSPSPRSVRRSGAGQEERVRPDSGSVCQVSGRLASLCCVSFLTCVSSSPVSHLCGSRFTGEQQTAFPSSPQGDDSARQHFLKLLVQQIQDCVVFEGPDGAKNLALNSQALREDLYFDVGCLLALSLVHGGPPVGFFSPALYQCLFNHPAHRPLTSSELLVFLFQIAEAESLDELREAMVASCDFLEMAGCNRPISSLEEREALVEDLVNFTMITRMQLPLQRFREGLQTLGVFDQVQLFPSVFFVVFCEAADHLTAQTVGRLFAVSFSEQDDKLNRETAVVTFWRHFLLECEVGRSSVSLQDLLQFSTGVEEVPAVGLLPAPSISFLHPPGLEEEGWRDEGLFPQSDLQSKHLLLPVSSSYQAFKSSLEQAVSHRVHLLLPTDS